MIKPGTEPVQCDVAIVGGGIAGLWLLNLLSDRGYSVVLIEKSALGAGQTLASQGMIHGGIKYALGGTTNRASETIRDMPGRWQRCLDGTGTIDLRGVKVSSDDYYLFSDASVTSKVTAFLGSKAIAGRVSPVPSEEVPAPFSDPQFSGLVYQLQDVVLDSESLIKHMADRYSERILYADPVCHLANGKLQALEAAERMIDAQHYVFAAGAGNEALIRSCDLPIKMQRRPLKQVIVRGDLPPLFAHAVNLKNADKPRVTFTSHRDADSQMVWYLGGMLAEEGVKRTDREQISFARKELKKLFPWIDFESCEINCFDIDRAEPHSDNAARPDTPYVFRQDNITVCWPVKLTLTPLLGDMVLEQINLPESSNSHLRLDHPVSISSSPWNQS